MPQMTSRRGRAARPILPFDLEAVIASYTPDEQDRIRRSVRHLNEGVPVDDVMRDLEQELVGPVAMAVIEGAVVANVSANNLLQHLSLSHMSMEEEQEFGYAGDSRTSVGLLPPTTPSTTALARYLFTIVPVLPEQVRTEACSYPPEDQAYVRRGFGRLRTGKLIGVISEEPRSHLISNIIVSLVEHALEAGVSMERALTRMGMPPFTETELMRLQRAPCGHAGGGAAGAAQ